MFLFRQEMNVVTGDLIKIVQQAYKNDDGHVIVLDASEDAPDGYTEYDPHASKEDLTPE